MQSANSLLNTNIIDYSMHQVLRVCHRTLPAMQSADSSPCISDYSMVTLQSRAGQHEFAKQNQQASQNMTCIRELMQALAA